jgi:hypothetical protein
MPQQPESPLSTLSASLAQLAGRPVESSASSNSDSQSAMQSQPHHVPRWLQRIELLLRVMLRMYVGLAICYAPWSHTFWDQNPFFLQFPMLQSIATLGAVRGLISGLGLLNLWIAFQDAVRHRDG